MPFSQPHQPPDSIRITEQLEEELISILLRLTGSPVFAEREQKHLETEDTSRRARIQGWRSLNIVPFQPFIAPAGSGEAIQPRSPVSKTRIELPANLFALSHASQRPNVFGPS